MDHGESGSGTPFESMSHEEMLAWLDQANSGAIQGAADRLVSAATEIRKIAEDLKVRPQWVEWKGEGADAFRTWSADLANSTLRLGDYSEGASKWLSQASNAIASAQAAIPRTQAGAQANLDAVLAARNDPDASAVAQKSAETLIATQEANRQEAAAQMRKLAQTYSLSASQMDGLEKPAFPPPPQAIVPPRERRRLGDESGYIGGESGGGHAATAGYVAAAQGQGAGSSDAVAAASGHVEVPAAGAPVARPVGMGIDGIAVLPDVSSVPAVTPSGLPSGGRPDSGLPSTGDAVPRAFGGGPVMPPGVSGGGRMTGVARPSVPGAGSGPLGAGVIGRPPGGSGITGGRAVPQTSGRPAGGIPRGTVIGGEGAQGRAPMGRAVGMGAGSGIGTGTGPSGMSGGRRLAGETGGTVGGRPQQPGRSSARPFTPGGTGLARGVTAAEGARGTGPAGRGLPMSSHASRTGDPRRDEGSERPDYLTEDEETWQQGGRRVVPPVID
ncbi:WXG100 family type VII secretion target [Streptomyces sp. NBC_01800]|uniref:WXG100 family type VII secretion target n=1 Tax=Streptomyces sp. NBC_01800 TaxID=2975945 RepID=UPI002DD7B18D|nr:hypothetical protein [Streptomyces sp. NBC_01800]WSA68477.1 hypothetical protein OIE65_16625 [Streptomyces sp. NBC_01800]